MPTKSLDRTKSILTMSNTEAREFLLQPESYCSIELPPYFQFTEVLEAVAETMKCKSIRSFQKDKPHTVSDINHQLFSNKDGRISWRPFEIIHPALYYDLVCEITNPEAWKTIIERFSQFSKVPCIECASIPAESRTDRKDQAEQVLNWWNAIELKSLELALDYQYAFHADITNCYGAIYTHSISWALHTRKFAKDNRLDKKLLGNIIDEKIRDMRHGQTNGIPQGSVLMDFIAEMVLGYADELLCEKIRDIGIRKYHIIRYRDDYRILTNSPLLGEKIIKALSETLIDLGLKLNASKTTGAEAIIEASLKRDKWAWLLHKKSDKDLRKHLLIIHAHSRDYPNAGSLVKPLIEFHTRLLRVKSVHNAAALVGIVVDIGYHNPRVFPQCAAITSRLLQLINRKSDQKRILKKVLNRVQSLPNTGILEVWLQRISYPIKADLDFEEILCDLVKSEEYCLWNNDWINSEALRAAAETDIIDREYLQDMDQVIAVQEINLFSYV